MADDQTRERNSNWRGGRSIASNGYVLIRVGVGHHLADVRGYAYEHRVVAEKMLGRKLAPGELVHHRDENRQNNDPGNLIVCEGNAEHFVHHRTVGLNRRLPGEGNPRIECACGCGTSFDKFDGSGRPRAFVSGHNPPAVSFAGDVLLYLQIVPESTRAAFIAGFFGVEVRKVSEALSKLKSRGLATKHGKYWEAA